MLIEKGNGRGAIRRAPPRSRAAPVLEYPLAIAHLRSPGRRPASHGGMEKGALTFAIRAAAVRRFPEPLAPAAGPWRRRRRRPRTCRLRDRRDGAAGMDTASHGAAGRLDAAARLDTGACLDAAARRDTGACVDAAARMGAAARMDAPCGSWVLDGTWRPRGPRR